MRTGLEGAGWTKVRLWSRLGYWPGRLGLLLLVWVLAWIVVSWPLTRAAALLVAAAGGLLILVRPALGLPMLAVAVPFGSLGSIGMGPGAIGLADLLLAAICGAWLLRRLAKGRLDLRWPPFAVAGVLLLATMLLSFLPATELSGAIKETVKWAELWVAAVLVLNLVDAGSAVWLALGLLAAGAAEGLLGLYQSLMQTGPKGFLLAGGIMRAAGTFQQPNPYGGYLGMTLPLAAGLLLTAWPGRAVSVRRRQLAAVWLTAAVAAVLIAGGLFASWSRGAWLGAAVGVTSVVLARGGRLLKVALVSGVVGVLVSFASWGRLPLPGALEQRFSDYVADFTTIDVRTVEVTDANFAVVERVAHWQAAWNMFAERPWTGVGLGNYATVYPRYALPRWGDPLGHAHNYYLNMAAEAGLPGLAAYLVWAGAGLWVAIRAVRVSTGLWRGLALGTLGMWAHLAVHSFFDNLYVHAMSIHMGLLLGLAAWVIQHAGRAGDAASSS